MPCRNAVRIVLTMAMLVPPFCAPASAGASGATAPATTRSATNAALRAWPALPPEQNAAPAFYAVADDWVRPELSRNAPPFDFKLRHASVDWPPDEVDQARAWLRHWTKQLQRLDTVMPEMRIDW